MRAVLVLGCSLDQWSTSGVSLATGLTGCVVLVIRTVRGRVIDDERRTVNGDG